MAKRNITSGMIFESHGQCGALNSVIVGVMLGEGRAKIRRVRTGGLVWNPASKPDRVFLLRSGRVSIVSSDTRGNEVILRSIQPGEIFGEVCFCSHRDSPHGTSAVAVTSAEILEAGYEHFRTQLSEQPATMTALLRLFCVRLDDAGQRLQILAEHDARQRLRKLLAYVAASRGTPSRQGGSQVSVTITHAELASLGALSRPHLSLLMTEFRREGLVSYTRGSALRIATAKLREQTYMP